MQRSWARWAVLVSLVASLAAAEPAPVLPPALAHAQAAARDLPAVRLAFTQIKHLAILDEPLTTPGCLEIDRVAGALRWEFTGQAVLIFRAGHLRRWGPDGREENLAQDPGGQALTSQMQALLTGDWTPLTTMFALRETTPDTVTFTPLTSDIGRFIAQLQITFTPSGVPTELTLDTANGDQTAYHFAPPEVNWRPTPARFTGP